MSDAIDSRGGATDSAGLPPWLAADAAEALGQRERWPHALLVCGPAGIGKRALAMHFARALVCEKPRADGSACDTCASCHYADAGQHPDLKIVEPVEVDDEGVSTPTDTIKVNSIRALLEWTQVTSHRGGFKVALIVPAERMHASAVNALLKTLEEPPAGTFLMLVSHQPGLLPATIVSRCSRRAIARPHADEALPWLREHGAADPASLLAQAGGAPLIALSLADASHQSERSAWLGALARPERLSPPALAARVELGGREERRDRLAAAIDWLIGWTGDIARIAAGDAAVRNIDYAGELAALGGRVAGIPLFRYHRRLLQQRTVIAHPLQPRLVAEDLLIDYRALFADHRG